MAGNMSQDELEVLGELDVIIHVMLDQGKNPYHIAMALGRSRWDLLTITNRLARRHQGILPNDLRDKVKVIMHP